MTTGHSSEKLRIKSLRKPQSGSKLKTDQLRNDSSFAVQFSDSVSKTRAILLFTIKIMEMFELHASMSLMRSAEYRATIPLKFLIIIHNYANVQTINQSKSLPGFWVAVTSLDGINGWSIQTLLTGENDSKRSDEIQTKTIEDSLVFNALVFLHTQEKENSSSRAPVIVNTLSAEFFFTRNYWHPQTSKHYHISGCFSRGGSRGRVQGVRTPPPG